MKPKRFLKNLGAQGLCRRVWFPSPRLANAFKREPVHGTPAFYQSHVQTEERSSSCLS